MHYLKGILSYGLFFLSTIDLVLQTYFDAD